MDFITATPNFPFVIALCVMFGVALLEGVGTLVGGGVSHLIDSALPELDVDLEVDAGVDADGFTDLDSGDGPSLLTRGLGWLHFGRVPALVLLVLFLTAFGLLGLAVQAIAQSGLGLLLPRWIAVPAALFLTLPVVRLGGGLLARIVPKDETTAVSSDSFVGRVATIVIGCARRNAPTQARLRDEHGRSHYVLVEPDISHDEFPTGTEVLLVQREGARFRAIRAPHGPLLDPARA